jgi:acyl-CoA synthetase (AMP-forming)/AMP-acid ligase II
VDVVDDFAGALHGLGVRKGDRIALVLPNCPQAVIAFYAGRRRAVVAQCNPLYTEAELHHQLSDCGAKVAIVLDKVYDTVAKARHGIDVHDVVVTKLVDYFPWHLRKLLSLPLSWPKETELQEWCADRLVAYKVPKIIEFRDDLPKNMLGKVLRRVLRDEVARATR